MFLKKLFLLWSFVVLASSASADINRPSFVVTWAGLQTLTTTADVASDVIDGNQFIKNAYTVQVWTVTATQTAQLCLQFQDEVTLLWQNFECTTAETANITRLSVYGVGLDSTTIALGWNVPIRLPEKFRFFVNVTNALSVTLKLTVIPVGN